MRGPAKLSLLLGFFLLGIFAASFLFPLIILDHLNFGYFLIGLALILILVLILPRKIKFCLILILVFFLGAFFYYYSLPLKDSQHISSYNGNRVSITGWVCVQPEKLIDKNRYQICPLELKILKKKITNPQGKILLSLDVSRDQYHYGQVVEFESKLYQPKIYPDFNYFAYLANKQIYSTSYPTDVKIKDEYQPEGVLSRIKYFLYKNIYNLKQLLLGAVDRLFDEPYTSLFNGLLFGETSGFSSEVEKAFVDSGLIHIVVVSGFNITILVMVFFKTTKRLSNSLAFWLGSLAIVLFVIMVGASPPSVRAGIMGWIVLLGSLRGREADKLVLVLLSAFIMSLFNPTIVRYDLGFQLSFLATIGLFFFSPITESFLDKIYLSNYLPNILKISLIETLSAQILTFPLILYTFSRVSLVAPVANILVLPLIPALMFIGLGLIVVAFLWYNLAGLIASIYELALRYIIGVAKFFGNLPLASLEFKWFNIYLMSFVYFLILILIIKSEKRVEKKT
jgi:competence protein ComEC